MGPRIKTIILAMLLLPTTLVAQRYSSEIRSLPSVDPSLGHREGAGAESAAIEQGILARAAKRSHYDQLKDYLGTFPAANASRRPSDEERVGRLLQDPALEANYRRIPEEWFRGSLSRWGGRALFGTYREYLQCKVMISRNLYLRGLEPTAANVRQEYTRIQDLRRRYRDLGLFSQRRVVFAASGDRLKTSNEFVFASGPIQRRIQDQAATFSFLRSSGARSKAELTAELRRPEAGEPLTFVYDGHGRNSVLDFGGGYSYNRIAEALLSTGADSAPRSPAILILSACRSHTLSRKLLTKLKGSAAGHPTPIVVLPEEFGQEFVKGVHQEPFFRHDLRVAARTEAFLGSLFHEARINASVYVPDDDNVAAQIA